MFDCFFVVVLLKNKSDLAGKHWARGPNADFVNCQPISSSTNFPLKGKPEKRGKETETRAGKRWLTDFQLAFSQISAQDTILGKQQSGRTQTPSCTSPSLTSSTSTNLSRTQKVLLQQMREISRKFISSHIIYFK